MFFVLENNIIRLMVTNTFQLEETAINSKMWCNYACTFIGDWEEKVIRKISLEPLSFSRNTDIFAVWQHDKEALETFQKNGK